MTKLSFSGHDSFFCKHFWLKKGFDFINSKNKFSDESAVVELGVGKNMVTSIRYWLKAFDLADENEELTDIGKYLFGNKGVDPFLEDFGTVWLLHYNLVTRGKASIYDLVFNEFRRERIEFTRENLHKFLKKKCESFPSNAYNKNTIETDISVFVRNYASPLNKEGKVDVEEDFSGLLYDLELLSTYSQTSEGKKMELLKIEADVRPDLPFQIVLYSILDNPAYDETISFRELLNGFNSPGAVFALNSDGLYSKIELITKNYKQAVYTETAGNKVLQFKSTLDKWKVLNDYYNA